MGSFLTKNIMKIAIISDIHENFYNLVSFYEKIEGMNIEHILCLWDLMNNGIAKTLAYSGIPVQMIWWNNDGSKVAIIKTSLSENSQLSVWEETFDIFEIAWRKLFLTHYPVLARPMAKSWDFDAVFFGHTHSVFAEQVNDSLLLNPGELSAHKTWTATFAIYDSDSNTAEIIELEDYQNMKFDKVSAYQKKIGIKSWNTKEYKL